jgi:2-polyprenyl-3-methyl-5-hydroxy-6-metoxy-1,4-benzoquinol methylase
MIDLAPRRLVRRARLLPDTVRSRRPATLGHPVSQAASASQLRDPRFHRWADALGESTTSLNRKVWEWAYTLEVLEQHGVLAPGCRALGFGCGQEPVPALLASRGVDVVATDQPVETAGEWATTQQHAESIAALRRPDLCPDDVFASHVSFVPADMTALPPGLTGFDAVWSSCALEHLGSIQAGLDFVLASVECVEPGGIAVHTTEFDVDGTEPAVDLGAVVLYRRRDLEALALELRHRGHRVKMNFYLGADAADLHVDEPPYSETHVRVRVGPAASTSFGIVIERDALRIAAAARRLRRAFDERRGAGRG